MEPNAAGKSNVILVVADSDATHQAFSVALRQRCSGLTAANSNAALVVEEGGLDAGFEVVCATSEQRALEELRERRGALNTAFVDFRQLPAQAACNVARALLRERPALRVVLYVEGSELSSLDCGEQADRLVLLSRPFHVLEVRQLARVLSRQARALGEQVQLGERMVHAEQLKVLVDNASDFLYQRDESGSMLYVSPGFCRMMGLPAVEWERQYPTLVADAKQLNPEAHLPVVQMLDSAERQHWLELDERFIDATREYVGVARDITKQRTLEQVLRSTQKLESIGRFAGGLAHDFNNLLTVISGHAEMLRLNGTSEDIEGILNATRQASELTRRLLMFSRDAPVAAELVDVNQLVKESSRMFGRLIRDNIRLDLDFNQDVGKVHISPSELARVMMNLVVNASDAMPRGGNLRISTQRVTRLPVTLGPGVASERFNDDWVVIRVSDTGIGMSPEVSERIFDPFFTTKGVGQGTGLGLSVVLGIVQQARGSVRVESRPGEGTTFELSLPASSDEASHIALSPRRSPLGAGQHVLVVDDNAPVAELTARVLKRGGYAVHVAASAADAIRLLTEAPSRYCLLVSDVIMPTMGGPELYSRAVRIAPHLAVLFMSGYAAQSLSDEPIDWERAVFLPKPWTPAELLVSAHRALHQCEELDQERRA
jgi:signal transduction histidine kinase/ActR/RegA family two-component response regulator